MEKIKSEPSNLEPPKHSSGDTAHLVANSLLSIIPGAAELFQYFVTPPLEKRRQLWMEDVGQALRDLQETQGVKLDELQSNDEFLDTILQATQIALRSTQQEKRRALRNAIINAALPSPPDHALQLMFLNFIDTFTDWHLVILKLFHEPALHPELKEFGHRQQLGGGLSTILEKAFPELKGNQAFYDQVWRDLYVRGLVTTEGLHSMMSSSGLLASRTTAIGKDFIKFVQEPT